MSVRALARINLAAVERNARRLRLALSPNTELCAVVKADGYGHGALPVARAARAGGATWLGVATAEEAAEIRTAGIGGRLLVMGAVSLEELPVALDAGAELVAWTERFLAEVVAEARAPAHLHVKLDTGMGRLGTRDADQALRLAEQIARPRTLMRLAGAMTHFATAESDLEFLSYQLDRFRPFAAEVRKRQPRAVLHGANSAATLREPRSHLDLVRCGIAIYGCDPMNQDPASVGLEPVLELTSYVASVSLAQPGDSVGYGRQYVASGPTLIGTLPIGYADGIRRDLSGHCDVLIGGRRYPVVGAISMDNVTVELGPETEVRVGERAVIIGTSGGERQTAEDLARSVDTISYEIVTGISPRVRREYHHDGRLV